MDWLVIVTILILPNWNSMSESKKVSLVLSSGGARGVAHIGVIEALEAHGYTIESISGSSMGAVIGGVYAAGKLPAFKEWISNLDKIDVFKLMDFTFSTQGFVRGDKVFNEMKKFMGNINIEDLYIPFRAVATDIGSKEEVIFSEGDLFTALRASAAIPSVVKPSLVGGRLLVDGGVLNPIPVHHVVRSGNDLLVISDVNANVPCIKESISQKDQPKISPWMERWNSLIPRNTEKEVKVKSPTLFDLIASSVDLMQDRISDFMVERAQPDILIKISRDTCATFEFYRAPHLIECGFKECKKALNEFHPGNQ